MKVSSAIALGLALGLGTLAHAQENSVGVRTVCEGFAPANTMQIPVGMKQLNRFGQQGGITEAQFNTVMDRIQLLYGDEVKGLGGTLQINRKWDDPTVNASAQQLGTTWVLNMYGGLARHHDITVDGMALVACHEMGHHMGGAPKIDGWYGSSWATNEGGADYYGTLKCARRFFTGDDNAAIIKTLEIDPLATSKCQEQWSKIEDQNLCIRSSAAAQSVTNLLSELGGDKTLPHFNSPDKSVVTRTNDAHPAAQCRLDTYFAGIGCKTDVTAALSNTDYKQGSCIVEQDSFGFRPTCWFKPN